MSRTIRLVAALILLVPATATLSGQAPAAAPVAAPTPAPAPEVAPAPAPAPNQAAPVSLAPVADAAVGIRANRSETPAPTPAPNPVESSRNMALMIVGGAALVVGLVIGGKAGTLVAVAGAVVGLVGLYKYLE